MEYILLAARLIVALVFAVAGVAKLLDRPGTRQGIAGFGVPATLVNPIGFVLPLAELAVAVALIPSVSAWWGALGAVALLLLFMAGIGINLARGNTPDCHCFGQLHSEPIGSVTLIRNGLLTAFAALIVAQGLGHSGVGPLDWLGGLTIAGQVGATAGALAAAVLVFLAWLALENRRLLARIEALDAAGTIPAPDGNPDQSLITLEPQVPKRSVAKTPIGAPAPAVSFIDMYGRTKSLADYRGWDTLVLLWDSNSPDCKQILPALRGLEARPPRAVPRLLVIVRASADANQTVDLRSPVVIDRDGSMARAFGASVTPAAILVDARGDIASGLAAGPEQVLGLTSGSAPHVRGRVRWAGLDLEVSRDAPPPRPEIESVAEKAAQLAWERGARVVAHIGTGSGAIAIFLARELPEARVFSVDVGAEALAMVRRNLERHGVVGRVELLQGDLLEPIPERPDLIMAGLPDVSDTSSAWGSELYVRLSRQMADRGWVVPSVFEISPEVSEGARGLLKTTFGSGEIEIFPDFQGANRIAVVMPEGAATGAKDRGTSTEEPVPALAGAPAASPTIIGRLTFPLLRRNAELRSRLAAVGARAGEAPGLAVGSPAPGFRLRNLDGKKITLDELRANGRAVLLLFVAPNCGPCTSLMPDITRWQTEYAPAVSVALIGSGSAEANRDKAEEHGTTQILLQKNFEVGTAYGVSGTPSAVIVHPNGTIASPVAAGPDMIRALLDKYTEALAAEAGVELADEGELARAMRKSASPLQVGAPAPDLQFTDMDENTVRLADFRGRDTVLLFWSTSCRFCHEMRPDVKEWEARRTNGAPELLIILAAPPEAGQTVAFRSPVVIDRDAAAAGALHSQGTPTAVLIDAAGNIASQPTVGAVPILELLGWAPAEEERVSA